jgi:hypothetical protein
MTPRSQNLQDTNVVPDQTKLITLPASLKYLSLLKRDRKELNMATISSRLDKWKNELKRMRYLC